MSGHQGFLQRGMEMAKKATEKDKTASQDKDTKVEVYEEIVRDYDHAIQQFMAAIKYDKNPKSQEAIRTKVVEYLKRAEDIKKHIEEMKAATIATCILTKSKARTTSKVTATFTAMDVGMQWMQTQAEPQQAWIPTAVVVVYML